MKKKINHKYLTDTKKRSEVVVVSVAEGHELAYSHVAWWAGRLDVPQRLHEGGIHLGASIRDGEVLQERGGLQVLSAWRRCVNKNTELTQHCMEERDVPVLYWDWKEIRNAVIFLLWSSQTLWWCSAAQRGCISVSWCCNVQIILYSNPFQLFFPSSCSSLSAVLPYRYDSETLKMIGAFSVQLYVRVEHLGPSHWTLFNIIVPVCVDSNWTQIHKGTTV